VRAGVLTGIGATDKVTVGLFDVDKNVAGADHRTLGGHLVSARISATFEGVVTKIEGEIDRTFNEKLGLNLIDI